MSRLLTTFISMFNISFIRQYVMKLAAIFKWKHNTMPVCQQQHIIMEAAAATTREELMPLFKSLEQRARLKVMELKEDGAEFELQSREILPHGGRLVIRFTFIPTHAPHHTPIVVCLNDHGETVNWEETLHLGKTASPFSNGNGESANGEPYPDKEAAQSHPVNLLPLPVEETPLPVHEVMQTLLENVQPQEEYEAEPMEDTTEAEPPQVMPEDAEPPFTDAEPSSNDLTATMAKYGIIAPDFLLPDSFPDDYPEPETPVHIEPASEIMEASNARFEFTQKASPWFFMKWHHSPEGESTKVLDLVVVNPYQNISFGGFAIANLSVLHNGLPYISLTPSPAGLNSLPPTGFFVKKFLLKNCAVPSCELGCQVDYIANKICLEGAQNSGSIRLAG